MHPPNVFDFGKQLREAVMPHIQITDPDGGLFKVITAMPRYQNFSLEELRWGGRLGPSIETILSEARFFIGQEGGCLVIYLPAPNCSQVWLLMQSFPFLCYQTQPLFLQGTLLVCRFGIGIYPHQSHVRPGLRDLPHTGWYRLISLSIPMSS